LKRFRGCKNVISLFRGKIEAENVGYVIAGSAMSIMHNMVSNNTSPLFNQFREEPIGYFDKIAGRKLVKKLIQCDIKTKDIIFKLGNGHPFYINAIATRVNTLNKLYGMKVDIDLVKRAYVIETLSFKGDIYKHCEYVYDVSLERAKYGNSLKAVLKILTSAPGLNQSELARKLRITQGAVRTYLNELVKFDLLVEIDNQYFFKDQILRYWLSYRELGTELSENPKVRVLDELISDLEKRYLRASSELGKAKEYEFRAKLEDKYGLKLRNYISADGQIEFDLVGLKDDIAYIFEIKWRSKPSNYKDLKKFVDKVKRSEFKTRAKMFFAAKSFTEQAVKYAEKNKVELIVNGI
jgi:DNA-binding MarR family transcriptional regulator